MNIIEAMDLKRGDKVLCPTDRGDPAYVGRVDLTPTHSIQENLHGVEFIWVSVRGVVGGVLVKTAVWPSHRLEKL